MPTMLLVAKNWLKSRFSYEKHPKKSILDIENFEIFKTKEKTSILLIRFETKFSNIILFFIFRKTSRKNNRSLIHYDVIYHWLCE